MKFLKTHEQHKVEHLNSLKEKIQTTNENIDDVAVNKHEIQSQRDSISAKIADIESKLIIDTDNKTDITEEENVDMDLMIELESQLENYRKELSDLDKLIR